MSNNQNKICILENTNGEVTSVILSMKKIIKNIMYKLRDIDFSLYTLIF